MSSFFSEEAPAADAGERMSSIDSVALSFLPLSWRRDVTERLRAGRSPGELLDELTSERSRRGLATAVKLRRRAAEALTQSAQGGTSPLMWSDAAYPPALAAIIDPPPVLWYRGKLSAFAPPAVAIVGSRAGSPYAIAVAEQLSADLAARGVVVVSGLARGVDSAAHRGVLGVTGAATIAVLGSGVNVIYPPEHEGLARDIEGDGLVVSELPPGTTPRPQFFPMRNRIISGLCRAVVVVEAGAPRAARWSKAATCSQCLVTC
jgi:DNA processing protein